MGQFDSLINAANKAIKNANALLENENTPFNVMYKQYKTLQSFWFRVIEDAADSSARRLEELCVDLEDVIQRCEMWIKANSPTKKQEPDIEK
jgi:hypothetical protein